VPGPRIAEELRKTQQILRSLTGREARVFRPPYGEWSPAVVETAASLGMTTILFDLASGDPDTSATAAKLIGYVVHKARNGSIVVMHVNGRGWHTAEALPEIIARLRVRGFELVTVGELVDRLPGAGHAVADTLHRNHHLQR
jgi:peptidoglycan/xylan/chitin deacetylase (PgdA/CDA1 family)